MYAYALCQVPRTCRDPHTEVAPIPRTLCYVSDFTSLVLRRLLIVGIHRQVFPHLETALVSYKDYPIVLKAPVLAHTRPRFTTHNIYSISVSLPGIGTSLSFPLASSYFLALPVFSFLALYLPIPSFPAIKKGLWVSSTGVSGFKPR